MSFVAVRSATDGPILGVNWGSHITQYGIYNLVAGQARDCGFVVVLHVGVIDIYFC